jgi:glycosyltransferase involved in cell wall biosynthesis
VRHATTVQTVCSAPHATADLRSLLFADRTVVLSRKTEQRVLAAGLDPARVRRIAPAVEALPLVEPEMRARDRRALGIDAQQALIVYPGDLEFSQGAERVVAAHARLPAAAAVQLAMACRRKTGAAVERERALRALSAQLGTAAQVRWLGEVADMHALLRAADVVALPAEDLFAKLDYPLVLIEAMLLERAVLVVEGTSAAELAEGEAAVSCAPTTAAVAAQLERLICDRSLREALGQRARAAALGRHDPAAMAQSYETVYEELLAEEVR